MDNSIESVEKPVKRKLRWYQFSLRSLLIFVTLFAVACSWFAVKMQQAKRQRDAVEALIKMGGDVEYNCELDSSGRPMQGAMPFGPTWVRKLLGDDFYGNVTIVNLGNSKKADVGLEQLKELRQLHHLYLNGTRITDAALENLKELKQLKTLDLQSTQVTDIGVEKLQKALPNCNIRH